MHAPVLPVGNEYLSIPHLDPRTGEIPDVFALSDRASGLLGLRGQRKPLLRIVCAHDDGSLHPFQPREAAREDAWTPVLRGSAGERDITVRFVAPPSERAIVISITATQPGTFGVAWNWDAVSVVTGEARDVPADLIVRAGDEDGVTTGEAFGPLPFIGWAIAADGDSATHVTDVDGDARRGALLRTCAAGEVGSFFVTVAIDGAGARRSALAMRATGAAAMVAETQRWLQARTVRLRDPAAEARANLNLFFNRFFATGRTLERGHLVAVTSRSPRHGNCGIFRARDALLWSLPGLCVQEPAWAGDLLLDFYESTWPQGGDHGLYLHGAPMFPADDLFS
ncbi:MAG: hypothetical protein FJX78_03910, partial [Armatimonadetes bacterium]|nr:hypothetical protein [Armatimonadota bacterium]